MFQDDPDQQKISLKVDFFSEYDKEQLSKLSSSKRLTEIVQAGVEVSTADFLTNYLLSELDLSVSGISTIDELRNQPDRARMTLGPKFVFNGPSLNWRGETVETERVEHTGESIGLAVINQVHGLNESDWTKIPVVHRGKHTLPVFDWKHVASDGKQIIEVETKGSCIRDDDIRGPAVELQREKIEEKKKKLRPLDASKGDSTPLLRYGTIAVISNVPQSTASCLLVDPPSQYLDVNPQYFRLLSRLRFLQSWFGLIAPRSHLTMALSMRVRDLEEIADPFELNC